MDASLTRALQCRAWAGHDRIAAPVPSRDAGTIARIRELVVPVHHPACTGSGRVTCKLLSRH
jgi:hypothetical protein